MKKPLSVFVINKKGLATTDVTKDADWVLQGFGYPVRIWSGIACLIKGNKLFSRYLAREGELPKGFEKAYDEEQEGTMVYGWIPVDSVSADFSNHREAWQAQQGLSDGLYMLVGPAINNNIENVDHNFFVGVEESRLDREPYSDFPRDFNSIRAFLKDNEMHGIMWIYEDQRAFILHKNFGYKRINEAPVVVQEPNQVQHQYIHDLKMEVERLKAQLGSKDTALSALEGERDDLKESLSALKNKRDRSGSGFKEPAAAKV